MISTIFECDESKERNWKAVIIFVLTAIFFLVFGKPSLESYLKGNVVIKESIETLKDSPSVTICPLVSYNCQARVPGLTD